MVANGSSARRFPVLLGWHEDRGGNDDFPRSIPWEAIEPHRQQAESNHCGQTLERLAQRGGLDPSEIYLAVNGLPFSHNGLDDDELRALGHDLVRRLATQ